MGRKKTSAFRINVGTEDEMPLESFRWSCKRAIAGWVAVVLCAGIPLILSSWKRSILLRFTHARCHPDVAHKVLLKDKYSKEYVEKVHRGHRPLKDGTECIYFCNKRTKYVWKTDLQRFVALQGLQVDNTSDFYEMSMGLSSMEVDYQMSLFGPNSLSIEMQPIYRLVLHEISSPFYIYQIFIVIVWLIQLYYQFSVCILLFSIISVSISVYQTRKQTRALKETVHTESLVTVIRDGAESKVSSKELVPGDVIIIPEQEHTMECDAVLISGDCIANESMLTGESSPVSKVPVSADDNYVSTVDKKSILFNGTTMLHSRNTDNKKVKAIVYRTGFSTLKGELVRSILYPKPVNFKLYTDLIRSTVIFLIIGIPAMIYTGVVFHRLGAFTVDIVITVIDVATFVVPPLLPAVLTSINAAAQKRLKDEGVYCLNSTCINLCGALDVVCFDKTGTLTDNSLDLSGIIPSEGGVLQPPVPHPRDLPRCPMVLALATCHSLHLVNHRLVGYPLDVKAFESICWSLVEPKGKEIEGFERVPPRVVKPPNPGEGGSNIAILRQFPFDSQMQRSSVIINVAESKQFQLFVKGAPEVIKELCRAETVPANFRETLEGYARRGLRILAVASNVLPKDTTWDRAQYMFTRAELEQDLKFEGFLVLQNKLKSGTAATINVLEAADIKTVMATGDNLLTAVTVACDCGMVKENDAVIQVEAELLNYSDLKVTYTYTKLPGLSEKLVLGHGGAIEDVSIPLLSDYTYHLAMDGKTFALIRAHDKELLRRIVLKGKVFARMLPQMKLQLVEALQEIGFQVGMCGDGANDCGALKAAQAGISLSVAEASVASPFTAQKGNIQCIPDVIREGRATLSATFGAFRYMVCYCFVLLMGALYLFWDGQTPSQGAYVFIDIVVSLLPPMLFGTSEAFSKIIKRPPAKSVSNFLSILSILSFIVIQTGFHVIAYYFCIRQPWHEPFVFDKSHIHTPAPTYMATAVLSINCMSHVIGAVVFMPGPPYTKTMITNKLYMAVVVFEFLAVSYVTLYPAAFLRDYINFKEAPHFQFHVVIYMLSLLNFAITYLWEVYFIQHLLHKVQTALRKMRGPIHMYEKIQRELSLDTKWPPMGKADTEPPSPDYDPDIALFRDSVIRRQPETPNTTPLRKFHGDDVHEMNIYERPSVTFKTFRQSDRRRHNNEVR
ncbi:polyamine-transporting ATPase 13A3-like [Ornithodoros turicata]